LLVSQAGDTVLVKFQFLPDLMDTPMVGIMGVSQDGYVEWVNSVANSLLKIPFECRSVGLKMEEVFDLKLQDFLELIGKGAAIQRLMNGFSVYMSAGICGKVSTAIRFSDFAIAEKPSRVEVPTSALLDCPTSQEGMEQSLAETESLRDADAELIKKNLAECKGNISKVAKRLKVSRGLIYRRVEELSINIASFKTTG
jgi:transcriptional regulator of acetoin/glycerol metabolism